MKKIFFKILLGLGSIVILGNINKISQSLSTPKNTTVIEEESLTQIQPSILCITPYHDGFPFDN